ncbi:dipeptide/oligopeptide/nickel ABC transporter permease/ATP-binding protein [Paenibacillus sp. RC67]|uniref:dipeptide/oligopeptide/nickel ABC transporter permease/ATP-binding protein n=1 Tax=Paenibacillus sp. RC67 TaxID=3039392 RepID=UPI0024AE6E87|nr:dipeptide/oligopeptide/nickel ABC transporter permease/ATP-binding protein [Paenibacillus sp. RC67]
MNKSKWIGIVVLTLFVLLAVGGPMVARFGPIAFDGERLSAPSGVHWLGTNSLGQDIFSQWIYGARNTFLIGLLVSILSTSLSGALGLAAGYSKRLDPVINGIANVLLVIPSLLLMLLVAAFTGGGIVQLILTLGLLSWPGYMRLIRASVLSLKEREFVKAAQLFQAKPGYILRKHLLPFIGPLLRTKFIMSFRQAVTMEAGLSFLGLGDPNQATWGKMLEQAFQQNETWMTSVWQWTVLPPALSLLLVTVGLALLGESARARNGAVSSVGSEPRSERISRSANKPEQPAVAFSPDVPVAAIGLSVAYGERTVLLPATFTVADGSITAVFGESGSGKTTLARALYGLQPRHTVQGEAFVSRKRIYGGGDTMRRWHDAAFIFQDPRQSFNPLLTIDQQFREVMQGRDGVSASAAAKRQEAAQALREVQLDERMLDCYPHQLSGGMLSRVAIALALVNKPSVLIADEPTGALDPIVKREILELLAAKVREHSMTLFLITHDIRAALHVADDVMVLKEGRLLEHSPREQWLNDPEADYSRELLSSLR